MYNREMETSSDWNQLFGGQLRELTAQSTSADLHSLVLQDSWDDDSFGELLYPQQSETDFLGDSTLHYSVDVIDAKHSSSLVIQEDPSQCDDVFYNLLSTSPEAAILPVDDDMVVANVTSTVNSCFRITAPSYAGSSGLAEAKFDLGGIVSGQQYLLQNVPENFYENHKIQIDFTRDLIEGNKAVRTDLLAGEHANPLNSFHYESQYKPATELEGIESAEYDSFLDEDSVCKILTQLIAAESGRQSMVRPVLVSVSPEEVESVLSSDSPCHSTEYDDVVPLSPAVSTANFLQLPDPTPSATAVLSTEYSQDCLSSSSSSRSSGYASSPGIPYCVEAKADRRLKKKEQNKTAALRYRNKKREEKGVVFTEVEVLEQKNAELQARADDLTKEINYLKSLLDEIKQQ